MNIESNYLDENMIVNKTFFEQFKPELTCQVCYGLPNNLILCLDCEATYCVNCFNWILSNTSLCLICEKSIKPKKPTRLLNNIIDSIILKCENCMEEMSILKYQQHYINCTNGLKVINKANDFVPNMIIKGSCYSTGNYMK